MCTLVILHRPGHDWPVVIGATRDEMQDRPWKPPARHWPDRPRVIAGIDEFAGGTWLGLNDDGVVAGILNRQGSLGPAPDKRSRGELPLEALDHARAEDAAGALAHLEPASYRSFNMVIADAERAFWLKSAAQGNGGGNGGGDNGGHNGGGDMPGAVTVQAIPPGVSMLTSHDLNDMRGARTRHHLPRFRAAPAPDPETGDWQAWQALFASRVRDTDAGPEGAMCIVTDYGYGTVSSALIALPRFDRIGMKPVWLFAAGRPGETPYEPVTL